MYIGQNPFQSAFRAAEWRDFLPSTAIFTAFYKKALKAMNLPLGSSGDKKV